MKANGVTESIEQVDVVVVGAGLTGLSLAHWLTRAGRSVRIIERSARLGGQIQTHEQGGFVYESGPTTGIISRPEVAELFASLSRGDLLQIAQPVARRRLILKAGQFHPLPSGLRSALSTPLFTWQDKLRILGEPFRPKGCDPNESIASLVERRLGKSYLRYAVDPFVGGIYAGDPSQLITRFALPKLYALEAEHGSFVRGAIAKMRQGKTERKRTATREVFSTRGGLGSLITALAERVGTEQCILSARIAEMRPTPSGQWQTLVASEGSERRLQSRWVVSTVGGYALGEALPCIAPSRLAPFTALRYAPVVQIAVGYRDASAIHFDAFGGLVPSAEDPDLLGILCPSACFSHRASEGGILLSVFAGGMRSPHFIQKSDEEIEQFVKTRLSSLLGIEQKPDLLHIFRHRHAIPQYEATTQERLEAIAQIETEYPGIIVAGNVRDGIGMADRIAQASTIAQHIIHTPNQ